jgi:hypothetical protein
MLGSITPLGERGRNRRWGVTVAAYLIGSTGGGLTIGGAAGAAGRALGLGSVPASVRLGVLALVVVVGLALDLRAAGLGLPTIHRQVNEDWMVRYRGWVYGLGFGFQLGLGVVTIVTTSTVYATLAAAMLTGSPAAGALIGGIFGIARGVMVFAVAGVRRPDQLGSVDARLRRWDGWTRRAALGAGAAISAVLAVGAVR